MLAEHGYTRATTADGAEFTFCPSLGRVARLGHPGEIVQVFAALFGEHALREARYVLAVLCEQDDVTPLTGWLGDDGWHDGAMPEQELVGIAVHLLKHGLVGTAKPKPGEDPPQKSAEFAASEYITAARVHLGLSYDDAQALSMTEFQALFAMKFPDTKGKKRDVPTREEYRAAMAAMG